MEKEIEKRIRKALAEEEPVSEQSVNQMAFLARMHWNLKSQKKRIGFAELLLAQFRFIGWRMWITELITAFVPTFLVMQFFNLRAITPVKTACLLSCLSIVISMLGIPFIYRSVYYRMAEMEAATFFSVRRLLLSRILILFAGELAAIAGVSAVTSMYTVFGFGRSMVYMLFLFGMCCNGTLLLLRRAETERLCRYFLIYGVLLLAAMLLFARVLPQFFDGTFQTGIVLGSCMLLGYCIYQSCMLVKCPEETTYA